MIFRFLQKHVLAHAAVTLIISFCIIAYIINFPVTPEAKKNLLILNLVQWGFLFLNWIIEFLRSRWPSTPTLSPEIESAVKKLAESLMEIEEPRKFAEKMWQDSKRNIGKFGCDDYVFLAAEKVWEEKSHSVEFIDNVDKFYFEYIEKEDLLNEGIKPL